MWNDLSMKEKSAIIGTAVKNKVYDLDHIRHIYDSGGDLREQRIKDINDWILKNPTRIFDDDFKEQRQYITKDTWNKIYRQNNVEIGDKNWKKNTVIYPTENI